MVGKPVPGPALMSRILLLGQAPGPHEERIGQPFAWTAGRTLFRWLQTATGAPEAVVRERIYFAAVARCFPGKAKGGGDRVPTRHEADACGIHLFREVALLQPLLVLPVGTLAISRVFGSAYKLVDVVGQSRRVSMYGIEMDAIALPHPSGLSTWPRSEPGLSLLQEALTLLSHHHAIKEAFL